MVDERRVLIGKVGKKKDQGIHESICDRKEKLNNRSIH